MSTITAEGEAARERAVVESRDTARDTRAFGELITEFRRAYRRLNDARREVNSAECELDNARNALGKRLIPRDYKDGERIGSWIRDPGGMRDVFLYVRKKPNGDFEVQEVAQ